MFCLAVRKQGRCVKFTHRAHVLLQLLHRLWVGLSGGVCISGAVGITAQAAVEQRKAGVEANSFGSSPYLRTVQSIQLVCATCSACVFFPVRVLAVGCCSPDFVQPGHLLGNNLVSSVIHQAVKMVAGW